MAITVQDLLNRASLIRDAVMAGENTALRVGSLLVDLVNVLTIIDSKAITADSLPDIDISKITNLTEVLNQKLDKSIFDQMFELVPNNGNPYIRAKLAIYSDGDVGAFGKDDDDNGGSGGSGDTAYNRLDAWADYDLSKSGWVLSAGLGADLNSRIKTIEDSLGDSTYATQTWVEAQGYLTSDALTSYATTDWVSAQGYLQLSDLYGYATKPWVYSQKYLQENDYASILDTRYYTEDEIDDKLGSYIASSGGTMTGALSFNRPGSRYGFYIEALDDGSMRVNATLDDQYLKGLFTFEADTRQFSLYKAYVAESLALDDQSVIYGSPAISDTQRIYLNHEKTVWVRYNATLNAIECSHSIVSHGDVAAFIE